MGSKTKILLTTLTLIFFSNNKTIASNIDPQLVNFCRTKFDKYTNNSSSWKTGRSSSYDTGVGFTGKMPSSFNMGASSSYDFSSSSNSINRNVSERDCDNIMTAYFQYLGTSEQASSDRDVGLAKASGDRDVGLAQFDAIKKIGVTSAKSSERVGLMGAKADLYTGIAGAAGNLLGSIFTSGNQKAAAKAIAQAEIEKEKIKAATELRKAELEHEIRMASFGIQPSRNQQYFAKQVHTSSIPHTPTNKSPIDYEEFNRNHPLPRQGDFSPYHKTNNISVKSSESRQGIASNEQIYNHRSSNINNKNTQPVKYMAFNSETINTPTTSQYHSNSLKTVEHLYPAKNSQASLNRASPAAFNKPSNFHSQSSRTPSVQTKSEDSPNLFSNTHPEINDFAKKHSLNPSNNCRNSIVIRVEQDTTSCFMPKPYLPAGFYTLNNGQLVKR